MGAPVRGALSGRAAPRLEQRERAHGLPPPARAVRRSVRARLGCPCLGRRLPLRRARATSLPLPPTRSLRTRIGMSTGCPAALVGTILASSVAQIALLFALPASLSRTRPSHPVSA